MIIFPEEDKSIKWYKEYAKEARNSLECTLKTIGNFPNQDIKIDDYEYISAHDILYSVKDNSETTFTFKNFGLDSDMKFTKRFRENYQVTMQRKDNNVKYKYDFSNLNKDVDGYDEIRLVEIIEQVNDDITVTLTNYQYIPINLIVEEGDKKYIICLPNVKDVCETEVFKRYEEIVENLRHAKELNLENILNCFGLKDVSSCYIKMNDESIASIAFNEGEIWWYHINDGNKKIDGSISCMTRKVEKTLDTQKIKYEETIDELSNSKIENDIKKLLKKM